MPLLLKSSLITILTLFIFGTIASYNTPTKHYTLLSTEPHPRLEGNLEPTSLEHHPLSRWFLFLYSDDAKMRKEAAYYPPPPRYLPTSIVVFELSRLLQDDDVTVRDAACHSLARLGPEARAAIPHLVEAIKDRQKVTWAVFALTEIGAPNVEQFESLVNHANAEVRRAGLQLLVAMRAPCSSIKELVERRKWDNDRLVRGWARSLAKICRTRSTNPSPPA